MGSGSVESAEANRSGEGRGTAIMRRAGRKRNEIWRPVSYRASWFCDMNLRCRLVVLVLASVEASARRVHCVANRTSRADTSKLANAPGKIRGRSPTANYCPAGINAGPASAGASITGEPTPYGAPPPTFEAHGGGPQLSPRLNQLRNKPPLPQLLQPLRLTAAMASNVRIQIFFMIELLSPCLVGLTLCCRNET
jgi:hypothetical protein